MNAMRAGSINTWLQKQRVVMMDSAMLIKDYGCKEFRVDFQMMISDVGCTFGHSSSRQYTR